MRKASHFRRSNVFRYGIILLMVVFILLFFVLNLIGGVVEISVQDVFNAISGSSDVQPTISAIVLQLRLPQTATALLAGAALAVAGLMMQSLFRNPLADPSILGISSGATLGVALLLLGGFFFRFRVTDLPLFLSDLAVTGAALGGAILILLLILAVSGVLKSNTNLLIVGIMIGYIAFSVVGILKYYSPKEDLQRFVIWGLGSFSQVSPSRLPMFTGLTILGLLASFLMAKPLNLLLLGEYYASNLGLNTNRARWFVILVSGGLTAVITAYCGPVAFIGLAVPHLTRNIFDTSSHGTLLPTSALMGGLLALIVNYVSRMAIFGGTLPISAVTALVGAPVVLWFIFKSSSFKQS